MAFAILRTEKLTSMGNIKGSLSHNFRTRPTPNADNERTKDNSHLRGSETVEESLQKFEERLATVKTVRKNAVLAIEYLITHSPDHNGGEFDNGYFIDALNWLGEKHGKDNVFCASIHLDETTPHMAAYVIPIDERGKLNASKWLDGRQTLSEMQTDFAEKVGMKHGLERGIEGSQAKHQSIKKYYSLVNEPLQEIKTKIPEVPEPTLGQKAAQALGVETEYSKAVSEAAEAKARRQAEIKHRNDAIVAKAKDYDGTKSQLQERNRQITEIRSTSQALKTDLEREKEKTKQLTDQMREIPLAAVLERLGGIQNPKDKSKWTVDGIEISPTGQKFKSFTHDEIKGGGAITLVRQVRGYDFNESLKWLSDNFGQGAATADYVQVAKKQAEHLITQTKAPSEIPKPEPKNWEHVKKWLLEVRKLPERAVDVLHDAGRLFADKFKNAVFLNKAKTGAEIVGTGEQRFKGFRGSKDEPMTYAETEIVKGKKVAIVESQIDAISAVYLGFDGAISTSGGLSETTIKSAKSLQEEGIQVYAAFDNDEAGKKFQLQAFKAGIKAGIAPRGKDWNDDLRSGHKPNFESSKEIKKGHELGGWGR
jgi:hypothetical protein